MDLNKMDTLDNILDNYIEAVKPDDKQKPIVVKALREKIIREIRPTIEDELHDSMKEKIQEEMEEKRKIDQAEHLKSLMLEGILLAFIVGMIVNQVTDIISVLKPEEVTKVWWIITIGSSGGFIGVIIFYIGIKLYNSLIELMKNAHGNV